MRLSRPPSKRRWTPAPSARARTCQNLPSRAPLKHARRHHGPSMRCERRQRHERHRRRHRHGRRRWHARRPAFARCARKRGRQRRGGARTAFPAGRWPSLRRPRSQHFPTTDRRCQARERAEARQRARQAAKDELRSIVKGWNEAFALPLDGASSWPSRASRISGDGRRANGASRRGRHGRHGRQHGRHGVDPSDGRMRLTRPAVRSVTQR